VTDYERDEAARARARARARRVDATGRSAERRRLGFGKGKGIETPFVPLSLRLKVSPAYRAQGIHARRVLDFLEREHMHHGGAENGRLAAPYRELVADGVTKRDCSKGIKQLIAYGLIVRTRYGGRLSGRDQPALYRITYLHDHLGDPPTNEWEKVTKADTEAWVSEQKAKAAGDRQRRAAAKPPGNIEGAPQRRGGASPIPRAKSLLDATVRPSIGGQTKDHLRGDHCKADGEVSP
jgi:hypothetical protein